ncbi:unnamed protein product, partial [Polarella glacialis]
IWFRAFFENSSIGYPSKQDYKLLQIEMATSLRCAGCFLALIATPRPSAAEVKQAQGGSSSIESGLASQVLFQTASSIAGLKHPALDSLGRAEQTLLMAAASTVGAIGDFLLSDIFLGSYTALLAAFASFHYLTT